MTVIHRIWRHFFSTESASSYVLLSCTLLALIAANGPTAPFYHLLRHESLVFIINEILMCFFFLLIGAELKREWLEGCLKEWRQVFLPGISALGGVLLPALLFWLLTRSHSTLARGWAIPCATDIAFAVGLLKLVYPKAPTSIKVFLTTLAIMDDLMAILIIALFYGGKINWLYLASLIPCSGLVWALQYGAPRQRWPYLASGVVLWTLCFWSGIHPALTGVWLALLMPLNMLKQVESRLHGAVAFCIMPLFAFVNAGTPLIETWSINELRHPITLGVSVGLFLGKQLGVFGTSFLLIRGFKWTLPEGADWKALYGVSLLAGIGFTMSLFVGTLAYEAAYLQDKMRLGVLLGSLVSTMSAFVWFRLTPLRRIQRLP